MPRIDLNLPTTTYQALGALSEAEGVSVTDLVLGAVDRDLYRRARAKRAVRPDERLVAPLRALLAQDIADATDWQDLDARLALKGFAFREAGAGLALIRCASGERVAKASDLGTTYSRLMQRFRAPFPGHSHRYLFERYLSASATHCDHPRGSV